MYFRTIDEKEIEENLYAKIRDLKSRINILEKEKNHFQENTTDKKDNHESRNNVYTSLVLITIATIALMAVYEVIKQILSPSITIWQSHIITIAFASTIAPVISFFALRKFDSLRQSALRELSERKRIEKQLQKVHQNLERRVESRTKELIKSNSTLKQEIVIRRETEKALRESEERYKLLFQNSPVGIFHFDSNLLITDYNKRLLEILNIPEIGETKIISWKQKDDGFYKAFRDALKGERGFYEGLYSTNNHSNKSYYISLKTAPFYDETSNVFGGIGIVENINERKQTERALLVAKEKAEKSDSLKAEFLAQMSHEIRTPLNSLLSFVNLLHDELYLEVNDELRPGFNIIENSGRRIIRTIDLILNMSEIQSGTFEYHPTHIDLYRDVILEQYVEFKPIAEEKNIELSITNKSHCSEIYADVFMLSQVFNHIISNAVKFTEHGSVLIELTTNANGMLQADIKDTGIGMSKEYMTNLFKPFMQEEQGYTRRYEGLGLGLALVKRYCEILDATLSVNSLKGVGTSFNIAFSSKTQLDLFN